MSRFPTGTFLNQEGFRLIEGQDEAPDKPDDPDKPDVPDKPDDPDKPDGPDKPDVPETKEEETLDILDQEFKNITDASLGFVPNKHIKGKDENSCSYWGTDEAKQKEGWGLKRLTMMRGLDPAATSAGSPSSHTDKWRGYI